MCFVDERRGDRVQPAATLDVELVGAVDHDLGDVGVAQERLERSVAEDVVGDLLRDAGAVGDRQRCLFLGEHALQGVPHLLLEVGLGELRVVELRAEVLEQRGMHGSLEIDERVGSAASGCRVRVVCLLGRVGVGIA